jgi:MFS family permease
MMFTKVLAQLTSSLNLPRAASLPKNHSSQVFLEITGPSTLGIVIAAFELGALVSVLSCLDLGDRLGRRSTVFLGMAFMVVGGTLRTSAWHVAQLIVGRVISGIGLGLQVATIPSWQSECAKPKSRGRWVMIEGGLRTASVARGQFVGYGSTSYSLLVGIKCRRRRSCRMIYRWQSRGGSWDLTSRIAARERISR